MLVAIDIGIGIDTGVGIGDSVGVGAKIIMSKLYLIIWWIKSFQSRQDNSKQSYYLVLIIL